MGTKYFRVVYANHEPEKFEAEDNARKRALSRMCDKPQLLEVTETTKDLPIQIAKVCKHTMPNERGFCDNCGAYVL